MIRFSRTNVPTFIVQRVQIVSVAGIIATCDKSLGGLGLTGGNGKLGGALASPGQAGALMVANGNLMWVKAGTYLITSASLNVAGGCPSLPAGATTIATLMGGYQVMRNDMGTRPLLQASGIATFVLITTAATSRIFNISIDGASLTSSRGIAMNQTVIAFRVKAVNFTNIAFSGGVTGLLVLCECSGCSTQAAITANAIFTVSYNHSVPAFQLSTTGSFAIHCIAANVTHIGFSCGGPASGTVINCTAYACTGGFRVSGGGAEQNTFVNCLAVNTTGYGFYGASLVGNTTLLNCAGYNNSLGNADNATIPLFQQIGLIALTADPFVNAAGNDFSLNATSGGGLLCREAGIPTASGMYSLPGISTPTYPSIGASIPRSLGPLFQSSIMGGTL